MKKNYLFKINLIFSLNLYIYIFFIYDPILQLTSTDKNIVVIFFLKQLFVEYVFFLLLFNLIFFFIFFKCSIKNEYLKKFGFFSIYFLLASTIYSYILPQPQIYFDNTNFQNKLNLVLFQNSTISTIIIDVFILLVIYFLCKFLNKKEYLFNKAPVILFLILSINLIFSFPYKNLSTKKIKIENLKISKNNNKILFILDGFRSSNYELLDSKIKKKLSLIHNDFIFFENAFTKHPGTWGSLTEIMAGYSPSFKKKIYDENDLSLDYYNKNNFKKKLNIQKFKNDYDFKRYLDHRGGDHLLDNYKIKLSSIFSKLPYSLKYLFLKNIDKIQLFKKLYFNFTSTNLLKYILDENSFGLYNDKSMYFANSKRILQNLSLNVEFVENNQFTIFYTKYPHPPSMMDSMCEIKFNLKDNLNNYLIQSYCTLKYIENFLKFLKKNDLYANSEIIITSDHGWPRFTGENIDDIEKKIQSWQTRFSINLLGTLLLYKPIREKKNIIDLLKDQNILPVQFSKNILCDGINDQFICKDVLKLDQILNLKEQEIFIIDPKNERKFKNYAIIDGNFKKFNSWKMYK